MFQRRKIHDAETQTRHSAADAALRKSQEDYERLQSIKPAVEATVQGHRKLLKENHFAERMWYAYRGEVHQ